MADNQHFRADSVITRRLMDHLVKAFEEFADEMAQKTPEGLKYLDAMMGCHNFYKAILLDLEFRSGDDAGLWRKMAVETLALALGIPIEMRSP